MRPGLPFLVDPGSWSSTVVVTEFNALNTHTHTLTHTPADGPHPRHQRNSLPQCSPGWLASPGTLPRTASGRQHLGQDLARPPGSRQCPCSPPLPLDFGGGPPRGPSPPGGTLVPARVGAIATPFTGPSVFIKLARPRCPASRAPGAPDFVTRAQLSTQGEVVLSLHPQLQSASTSAQGPGKGLLPHSASPPTSPSHLPAEAPSPVLLWPFLWLRLSSCRDPSHSHHRHPSSKGRWHPALITLQKLFLQCAEPVLIYKSLLHPILLSKEHPGHMYNPGPIHSTKPDWEQIMCWVWSLPSRISYPPCQMP